MKLIQLSDGRWVDPQTVTAVIASEEIPALPSCPDCLSRLTVYAGNVTSVVYYNHLAKAEQAADELAQLVNVALTPGT